MRLVKNYSAHPKGFLYSTQKLEPGDDVFKPANETGGHKELVKIMGL